MPDPRRYSGIPYGRRRKLNGAQPISAPAMFESRLAQGKLSDDQFSGYRPVPKSKYISMQSGRKEEGSSMKRKTILKRGVVRPPLEFSYKLDTNHHLVRGALHPSKLT